ncbi:hypothetical protein DEO72_LG9g2891 [Vigna unguiculata]|uniref:Uncharacterized protein n=1 Tax=Vigna unguiculata TaxID=3917 RepID=A0A4D6N241_VIGUN|nr:hypothetical protein DEO72_LG9g2891 [Vigna unguiculata]
MGYMFPKLTHLTKRRREVKEEWSLSSFSPSFSASFSLSFSVVLQPFILCGVVPHIFARSWWSLEVHSFKEVLHVSSSK